MQTDEARNPAHQPARAIDEMPGVLGVVRLSNRRITERQHFEHEARIIRARQGGQQIVPDIGKIGVMFCLKIKGIERHHLMTHCAAGSGTDRAVLSGGIGVEARGIAQIR